MTLGFRIIIALLVLVVGYVAADAVLGDRAMEVGFLLLSVLGALVAALFGARRKGASASIATLLLTPLAAGLSVWVLVGLDARWYVKGLLLLIVVGPVMSLANASFAADLRRGQAIRDGMASDRYCQVEAFAGRLRR